MPGDGVVRKVIQPDFEKKEAKFSTYVVILRRFFWPSRRFGRRTPTKKRPEQPKQPKQKPTRKDQLPQTVTLTAPPHEVTILEKTHVCV